MRKLALLPVILAYALLAAFLVVPVVQVSAGGPKCDRADSAKCGMDRCRAMKDKDGKTNCNNACHKGCCGCPDGSDPTEGKCPRDEPREYPQEENTASLHMMGCGHTHPTSICSRREEQ